MRPGHIVVVDGAWAGHHPAYVKTFAKILLGTGYKVSVLCPAPEEITAWMNDVSPYAAARFDARHFADGELRLPRLLPGRLVSLLTCLARWSCVSQAIRAMPATPDLVFFAWLDSYLNGNIPAWLLDWRFPWPWSGLYFQPRRLAGKNAGVDAGYISTSANKLIAKSKGACSVAVLDAGMVSTLRTQIPGKEVFVFPDFTDETPCDQGYPTAAQIRAKAGSRKIIGLLGSLERRKGFMTLLEMSKQPLAKDWYFVIAGELVAQTFSELELNEIKSFLDESRDNFFASLGRIPDDAKFNSLVNVCDVIFAVYENFPHSSNLITKAAIYGKSLLVSAGGYMEEVVRQYELGEVVPASDVGAAITALGKLAADGATYDRSAGMQAYSTAQSQGRLKQALPGLVEHCVGSAIAGNIKKQALQ